MQDGPKITFVNVILLSGLPVPRFFHTFCSGILMEAISGKISAWSARDFRKHGYSPGVTAGEMCMFMFQSH